MLNVESFPNAPVDERTLKDVRVLSVMAKPRDGSSTVLMEGMMDGMHSTASMSFSAAMRSHSERFVESVKRYGQALLTGRREPIGDAGAMIFAAQRALVDGNAYFAQAGVLTEQPARSLDGPDGPRCTGSKGPDWPQESVLASVRSAEIDY